MPRRRLLNRFDRRPGVTVIVVLMMIVSSLALAYMISRSQVAMVRLQNNADLDLLARQAAMTGFANGLRSMHESAWSGVGASISTTLNSQQSFTVSYATGDALLTTTDTNWPYRVTMLVVGKAVDLSSKVSATHGIQAVVQLLPRQLAAEPSNWSNMLNYTVYQYSADTFDLQLPCRIAGNVLVQGSLRLADDYPPSSAGQNQYMSDINSMQFFGYGDNRPLTGTVSLPYSNTSSGTLSDLNLLGVNTTNVTPSPATNWSYPGAITSYQLYPGGQTYTVPTAASTLQNTTLAAAPRTNPLGIFYASGNVSIGSNFTLTGTLVSGGDVTVTGSNVVMQPVALQALQGSTQGVQLPTVVVQNNFKVASQASATVNGMIACWSAFDVLAGSQSTTFAMQGRLICKGCLFEDRSEWQLTGSQWNSAWSGFNNQGFMSWIWFYPQYLQQKKGLLYTPNLTIVPETTPVTYHWKTATNTIYVPNPSDPGLRWTVVRWTDNVASH